MGFFDELKKQASQGLNNTVSNAARSVGQSVSNTAANALNNASYKTETFTFKSLPQDVSQLKALPEADLTTPFKTAALVMAVLCNYENDVQGTIDMVNFLKGPQPLSPYDIQFLRDRIKGRGYIPRSYFSGTNPQNNYTPTAPYSISVSEQKYSYENQGYAKLFLQSSGADSPRPIVLRQKGNQWFLWQNLALSDIRRPAEQDPWA